MSDATVDTAAEGLDLANPIHLVVQNRLIELQVALEQRDPNIKNHLAEIHKHMIQYEEIVHLLSEEQIAIVMKGQQQHTNTTLVQDVVKKKTSTSKKAATLGMADL